MEFRTKNQKKYMRKIPQIAPNVYYLGINDRRLELFENIWPLPHGVAYNSYLITDEHPTLIDTVDVAHIDEYIAKIKMILQDKNLEYLVVNHMEPDHCGAIETIRRVYPNVTIVGNKKTFEILYAYYAIQDNLFEVEEGAILDIGSRKLQFFSAPMVHWPEVMLAYDTTYKILFSADAFGSFGTLDGGITDEELYMDFYWDEFARYYANIVGKFGKPVQRALEKIQGLDISIIAATHGPIWKKQEHIKKILSLYQTWSRHKAEEGVVFVYGSMYGNTQIMAETIARELSEQGIKKIKVYDASKTHKSYILTDIFRYTGLIIGSSTYNADVLPQISSLLHTIEHMGIQNKVYASFGSYSWAGRAAQILKDFGIRMKWHTVPAFVEQQGSLNNELFEQGIQLARSFYVTLREK